MSGATATMPDTVTDVGDAGDGAAHTIIPDGMAAGMTLGSMIRGITVAGAMVAGTVLGIMVGDGVTHTIGTTTTGEAGILAEALHMAIAQQEHATTAQVAPRATTAAITTAVTTALATTTVITTTAMTTQQPTAQ